MSTKIEQLFGPQLRGPLGTLANSSAAQWAGVKAVNSGSATVTISTNVVNSDSMVFVQARTILGSHHAINLSVGSIAAGAAFTVILDKATVTSDYQFAWSVVLTS